MIRFESSPTLGTALVNNEIHIAGSVAYPTVLSIESRDPGILKIYLASGHTPDKYFSSLVAMPASGLRRIEDLKGKNVGIFPGPSAEIFFGLLFEKHGIDPIQDLNLVELQQELQINALVSGQVDVLATFEPVATQAVVEYGAIKIVPAAIESEVITPWHGGVSVVTAAFIEQNPDAAGLMIEALYEAVDYINNNPTEAKKALYAFTQISPLVAEKTPSPSFLRPHEFELSGLEEQMQILLDRGVLSQPVDISNLIIDIGHKVEE